MISMTFSMEDFINLHQESCQTQKSHKGCLDIKKRV